MVVRADRIARSAHPARRDPHPARRAGAAGATYSQIATELGVGKTTTRRALTTEMRGMLPML